MKSSRKKTISGLQTRESNLRLHYFPDIPLDHPSNNKRCGPEESGFQRISFEDTDPTCSNGSANDEIFQEGQSPSHENIEQTAFEKGFSEGQTVGFEAGLKNIEPVINSLNQALLQLENVRREIHDTAEQEVVRLALAIAKKIVCREVKTNQETVLGIARQALNKVEDPGKIKIKMNPVDIQVIKDAKSQLSHLLHNVQNVNFEAEDSIQSGGCIIETKLGDIDARIEKQFQVIEESFQTELKKSVPEK